MTPPKWNPRRVMDWMAVLFPLAVSVAANTTWAARDGDWVSIGFGVAVPILLVLSVERWHVRSVLDGWQYGVRVAAIIVVTAVVAAISWAHTSLLLFHHGWEVPLAVIAPLGIDGLAVLGTLALWPAVQAAATVEVTSNLGSEGAPPKEEPVSLAPPAPEPAGDSDTERIADLRAHATALGKMPGRDTIKARYGVGSSVANRLRAEAERPTLHLATGSK